jgi:hypothetical protein
MKKQKEKINISVSIDRKLDEYMEDLVSNKSKYIEWLIYQDLSKNDDEIKKIIL